MHRHYGFLDQLLIHVDEGIYTVFGNPPIPARESPGDLHPDNLHKETQLSEDEKRLSARLMRVNHSGEIAAQALYKGHALTSRSDEIRTKMEQAANEENDHLAWCAQRVHALGHNTSLLNPIWYTGSLTIGTVAGLLGDKWNLGFIAETEHQVVQHLEAHLQRLPANDHKSRSIVEQMKSDETQHATTAMESGAALLPTPIKKLMGLIAKVMTRSSFWV